VRAFFATDLHGQLDRYRKLLQAVESERPEAVFLGGDLLPHRWSTSLAGGDFIDEFLKPQVAELRARMGPGFPAICVILGNDDDRISEPKFLAGDREGLWIYCHGRWVEIGGFPILGYSMVPPTPFALKDWERYDVSRFVDPGCVSPEEGQRSVVASPDDLRFRTIAGDLDRLAAGHDLTRAVLLFHSPPHGTSLDRAALDGQSIDHVPLDTHVGSIAIRRFIESRQPLLTLHGHIHEAARLTGRWRQKIGRTICFNAAHDGPELALVRFDLEAIELATKELI
jgi:Icc-related predicted phosphoesterase